ncbi:MAG: NAD(P)-dependent glycerol-3-phosphate dehydrogenase [Rhodocyclaceae bacterium]|nr:NAD(P)-dependent glycerol-3-phosphate dehydrogenase [Rhodocyclaceae bacterium]
MKIAVLGAGAWGSALAIAFCARGDVALWARSAALVADLQAQRENCRYLPGIALPERLQVHANFAEACAGADYIVVATPVAGLRPTLHMLKEIGASAPAILVCKGFERSTGLLPHRVAAEVLGADYPCALLTGPSFADEVARGLPTAVTLAAADEHSALAWVAALHTGRLRLYANDDMNGCAVGGAVKNVLAIASGICDGLKFGLNARAALITRGLAEISRLGERLGGRPLTFMGLAGMGDLILTCTGDLSRNRRVGLLLAQGLSLDQAVGQLGHVAEGVGTAYEAARLAAELGVDMPITAAVAALLRGEVDTPTAVEQLLGRDPKLESRSA